MEESLTSDSDGVLSVLKLDVFQQSGGTFIISLPEKFVDEAEITLHSASVDSNAETESKWTARPVIKPHRRIAGVGNF